MRALVRYIARCLFADFLLLYFLFSPLFLLHITIILFQVSNHLPFAYISLTSLSSTPLHHEIQLRFIPQKLIFILLDSWACPKISITISLFICLTHAACCMPARKHPSYLWVLGEYEVEEMIYFFLAIAFT